MQARPRLPLLAVAMTQLLLVFNVTALKVSIEAIVASLSASASTVKSVMVVYSLVVAAVIVLGAKVDQILGARRMFRAMLLLFAAAMGATAVSAGPVMLFGAQILAGIASGVLLPTFVMLIGSHYRGRQRAQALGWLAASGAVSIVPALLLSGSLAMWPGWRFTFGLIGVLALILFKVSDPLRAEPGRGPARLDGVGLLLATAAIFLIGFGCNNVTEWGSSALLLILCGVLSVKAFLVWSRRLQAAGGTPLIALEAFSSSQERMALLSMFIISMLASAITFVIPLYIEVVQGRSAMYTAVALVPFALASFLAALLVVRVRRVVHPSRMAGYAFLTVAIGAGLLGSTMSNAWSDRAVIVGLLIVGAGEGALATLLFKLLVARAVRKPGVDIGPVCGSTDYLAAGVGAALSTALVFAVLASGVQHRLNENPRIPAALKAQVDLDNVSFVSNDRLRATLSSTTATSDQVDEAVRINTEARLNALRICFLTLAGVALIAFLPARALPDFPRGRR